jgi:hypothetical protein
LWIIELRLSCTVKKYFELEETDKILINRKWYERRRKRRKEERKNERKIEKRTHLNGDKS